MEHSPAAAWLTEAASAAQQQGPGNLLRVVLIVMFVGCVADRVVPAARVTSRRTTAGAREFPAASRSAPSAPNGGVGVIAAEGARLRWADSLYPAHTG